MTQCKHLILSPPVRPWYGEPLPLDVIRVLAAVNPRALWLSNRSIRSTLLTIPQSARIVVPCLIPTAWTRGSAVLTFDPAAVCWVTSGKQEKE